MRLRYSAEFVIGKLIRLLNPSAIVFIAPCSPQPIASANEYQNSHLWSKGREYLDSTLRLSPT